MVKDIWAFLRSFVTFLTGCFVWQIEGVLPSKKKTEEAAMKAGTKEFSLDPDTLAQVRHLAEFIKSRLQSSELGAISLLRSFKDETCKQPK